MAVVFLKNGCASVKINADTDLICLTYKGEYDLIARHYDGNYAYTGTICEGKKRLSTINRYAAEYGVEFRA